MAVIGFDFSKFDCERKKASAKGSIEIKHNISVNTVEKTSLNVGGAKNDVLRVEFAFDIVYGSGLGKLSLVGHVVYADTPEIIDESFKGWEADKKLNTMVNEQVHKFVYNKAIVKAISFGR